MGRSNRDVTEAELALLQALWEGGPATVRRLAEGVYSDAAASTIASVQKLLERLEAKGCVSRDRSAAAHVFAAAVSREALIGRRLRDVAESLCGGSLAPLLTHLVRSESLTRAELDGLRALIDRLDGAKGGKGRKP